MDSVRIGQWVATAEGQDGFTLEGGALDDWTGGVDVRRDTTPRPQAHGSFDLPGFLDSRVLPLSGLCFADSAERLNWFGSQLTGLLADGGSGMVTVELDGLTTYGFGRLASKVEFQTLVPGSIARYQIQLWFANPRKFGESRTFGSGTPAYHAGNFPAAPVFTITGARAGYAIPGPSGRSFVVSRAIAGSEVHTVDMADGLLRVNGVVVFGGVSRADLWAVPGGGQVTHTLAGLTTTVRDTFI